MSICSKPSLFNTLIIDSMSNQISFYMSNEGQSATIPIVGGLDCVPDPWTEIHLNWISLRGLVSLFSIYLDYFCLNMD